MGSRADITYIPIKERFNHGELNFPKLNVSIEQSPTLLDLKRNDVNLTYRQRIARDKKVSKSNKILSQRLGASSDYRKVRFNMSYKPVLDLIGDDFPLHPEYLYVINIITSYYGVPITDVIEYALYVEQLKNVRNAQMNYSTRVFNVPVSACLNMVIYILYARYEVNPNVIMSLFSIGITRLRSIIETFCRHYENSEAVRADYHIIFGRLLELQPKD